VRRGSLAAAVLLCLVAGCGDKSADDSGTTTTEAQNETGSDQGLGGTTDPGTGNGNTGGETGGSDSGDGGGNAVGAPKPHKGGGAKGAPIKIPSQVADEGRDLQVMISFIRSSIRKQCGGTDCVHFRIENSEEGRKRCEFIRTVPEQETTIRRGSTFVIVAGDTPCVESSSAGDENDDESGDDQTGDESGDQTGGQPDDHSSQPAGDSSS
jgi:hypothetical protein